MFRTVRFLAAIAALVGSTAGVVFAGPVTGAFTYQGALNDGGSPANGVYDFWFRLWDAPAAGNAIGSMLTVSDVQVTNGVFTIALNFGMDAFNDQQRYLEMAVRPDGAGQYTLLTPRQVLFAGGVAQYALAGGSWRQSGDVLYNTNDDKTVLINRSFKVTNSEYFGVDAPTTGYGGMYVNTPLGGEPFYGYSQGGFERAWTYVDGENYSWNLNVNGSNRMTVRSDGAIGIGTSNPSAAGLDIWTGFGSALHAESIHGTGTGVYGKGAQYGTVGSSEAGYGIVGTTTSGRAVYGSNGGSNSTGYAGWFNGRTHVAGNLHVGGTLSKLNGTFKIDHPLDPANKTLSHSFVESPDMMNLYNGNVTTDADGRATITLPDWFEALNRDFRYQLTPIGSFARAMVEREVEGNRFVIRTEQPNVRVSWQVSGVRQDPYAIDHPIAVEADKPAAERGTYLYPAGYAKAGAATQATPRAANASDPNTSNAKASNPTKGGR